MIEFMKSTLALSHAYETNAFIYRLKHLPIIKKFLPSTLYANRGLKDLVGLLSTLFHIGFLLLRKFGYAFLFLFLPLDKASFFGPSTLLTIFFFLTILGSFYNNEIIEPTKEKYYASVLMRIDARKYALSSFMLNLIEQVIGFFFVFLIAILIFHIPFYIFPFLFLFLLSEKIIGASICLHYFKKRKKLLSKNYILMIACYIIFIALAYGLPFLGIFITPLLFLIFTVISITLAFIAWKKIQKSDIFYPLYRKILTKNQIFFDAEERQLKMQTNVYQKKLEIGKEFTTKKTGYAYLNELFTRRHQAILTKSAIRFALVYLVIFAGITVFLFLIPETNERINRMIMTFLPYFVFIMYFTNRGSVITQAMFINCDHSLLTYRFYRKPNVILSLFKERLKTLIKINLIPTLVIALGLPILLLLSGGTHNIYNYFLLFAAIMAMSIFFSVHYLVLYYLLQPYDINMKQKSTLYGIISGATYFVSYYCIQLNAPTTLFAMFVILFSILYVGIALVLIYKKASQTFKLKN